MRATFEHDGSGRSQLPAELTNPDSPVRLPDLPEGDRIVLARVDLGTGVFPDAPRVAAEQAQAVVTVASVRAGDRYWRPLDGYIHATDGRVTGWSSFGQPFHRADVAPDLDRTADEFGTLAATLGRRLPVVDPALTETIDALGWWQSAADQPALAAIVLDVRVLELVAARVTSGAWYDCEGEQGRCAKRRPRPGLTLGTTGVLPSDRSVDQLSGTPPGATSADGVTSEEPGRGPPSQYCPPPRCGCLAYQPPSRKG